MLSAEFERKYTKLFSLADEVFFGFFVLFFFFVFSLSLFSYTFWICGFLKTTMSKVLF